jgi:hypothetical protein
MQSLSLSHHTLRQLKFVIPGAAICLYFGIIDEFLRIAGSVNSDGWGRYVQSVLLFASMFKASFSFHVHHSRYVNRTAAILSLGLGIITIVLFMYVLLTPWIKGVEPNVRSPDSAYMDNM